MVLLLATPRTDQAELWRRLLAHRLDDVELRVWPDVGDPRDVEVALAWRAPPGVLAGLPNLRLICSLGMGVDHILEDDTLPPGVPIVRLVDPNMIEQMSEYVLYAVLRFHRRFDVYERQQAERRWEELPLPHTAHRHVGIMGLGAIGTDCARKLAGLGFVVSGWSRSPKAEEGVRCYAGMDQLDSFLAQAEILVAVLPLTVDTAGIVNARALSLLPDGACFINVARGGLVVEADLLAALDSGRLGGAMLDVVQHEPPSPDSPIWTHPLIRLTPHIAGLTNPETAVESIADNIRRLRAGRTLKDRVDPARGY